MAHRGFASEEEAETVIGAESLLLTRDADQGGELPHVPPRRRPWRWAVAALLAAGAGLATWMLDI